MSAEPSFVTVLRGEGPLVLSIPHGGTEIPEEILARLVSPALALKDTDWRMAELYGFAHARGATIVRTAISRTVIDVNRDPSGASLYPGQATTGLVPTETFDGEPLYRPGEEPDAAEVSRRRTLWFEPYHAVLRGEVERVRSVCGRAVLYDCHSIRSRVPRLFEGELPVFNIGTNDGRSCRPSIAQAAATMCTRTGLPTVVDGRFKGGWITRHYGRPEEGVDAIQMELAQRFYMDEANPARSNPTLQDAAAGVLATILDTILASLAVSGR